MENKEQKKKIQIGIKSHFPESAVNEPIYADWTPELQKGQDEMFNNFAKFIADEIIEYQKKWWWFIKTWNSWWKTTHERLLSKEGRWEKKKKRAWIYKKKNDRWRLRRVFKMERKQQKVILLHQKL